MRGELREIAVVFSAFSPPELTRKIIAWEKGRRGYEIYYTASLTGGNSCAPYRQVSVYQFNPDSPSLRGIERNVPVPEKPVKLSPFAEAHHRMWREQLKIAKEEFEVSIGLRSKEPDEVEQIREIYTRKSYGELDQMIKNHEWSPYKLWLHAHTLLKEIDRLNDMALEFIVERANNIPETEEPKLKSYYQLPLNQVEQIRKKWNSELFVVEDVMKDREQVLTLFGDLHALLREADGLTVKCRILDDTCEALSEECSRQKTNIGTTDLLFERLQKEVWDGEAEIRRLKNVTKEKEAVEKAD